VAAALVALDGCVVRDISIKSSAQVVGETLLPTKYRGPSSWFKFVSDTRIILHPYDMLPTDLPYQLDPFALGLFMRMLPYVLHPRPFDMAVFARLAGVSTARMKKWWPEIDRLCFTRDEQGNVVLACAEWFTVQTVTAERQPLRHLLKTLVAFWGSACAYCGHEAEALEIEHIVPVVRGGSDDLTNLTLACKPCNLKKRTLTAAEFGHPHIHELAKRIQ
jgi:5-methylcytosine-specific restriction endonuclease McrA